MKDSLLYFSMLLIIFLGACNSNKTNPDGTRIIKEYHKNRMLKSEITVKDTLRQGITKNYNENGRLISSVMYVDNKKHGPTINYYAKSGAVNQEMNFINNELEGEAKMFFESGKLYMLSGFKEGKKHGTEKTFYENGSVQSECDYYKGYAGIGLKEYADGGKLISTPTIVVKQGKNFGNGFLELKISLSDNSTAVKFYNDTLIQKKYSFGYMREIPTKAGVGSLEWRPGTRANIIAVKVTQRRNKMIIFKQYP